MQLEFDTAEVAGFVIDYFERSTYGSLSAISGCYLDTKELIPTNVRRDYLTDTEKIIIKNARRTTSKVILMLHKLGYIDRFSNKSWKKIREITVLEIKSFTS